MEEIIKDLEDLKRENRESLIQLDNKIMAILNTSESLFDDICDFVNNCFNYSYYFTYKNETHIVNIQFDLDRDIEADDEYISYELLNSNAKIVYIEY